MQPNPPHTFRPTWNSDNTTTAMPSTTVQLFQNGTLYSVNLPGARNPREIERLQEYIQNTAFGTTNLMRSMSEDSIKFLRNHYYWSEKMIGGNFDGLSRQETRWLEEQGWVDDRQPSKQELSQDQMHLLPEHSMPKSQPASSVVTPAQTAARPMVDHQSHPAEEKTKNEVFLGEPVPDAYFIESGTTGAWSVPYNNARVEATATAVSQGVGVIGDGRPASPDAQEPAYSHPPRASTPSTIVFSTDSECSTEDLSSRFSSTSSSPLAQLVATTTPDDSDAEARPTPVRITLTATIRHESLHGQWCPFGCKFDPNTSTWVMQQARLEAWLTEPWMIDSRAVPENVPVLEDDYVAPVVDWDRERRRWIFSRGGRRGDPAMDSREW